MKPNNKQIALYKQIREITEQHHTYGDQMMAIAMWIDAEFKQKSKRTEQQRSDSNCNIPYVNQQRELLLSFMKEHYKKEHWPNVTESVNKNIDSFLANNSG
jgi:2-oxoglutarate dehydrogenase complex dehydrogenase (E1) component-like enzyme